ncbi:baseplate J/gp47 family protein [Lysinibacillus sp. 54212]|uniref:baseplate J/gp47 family protein n=1 Tax=Lysinibacillus sp. 54212 TaxID=3119829 RepID=UPI002FC731DA
MLDRNGFKRKTYDDLLNDMTSKAQELFGANANVSERGVLGRLLRIMAWFLSLAWQAIEAVFHSGFRNSAEGTNLDKLLPYAGITRNLAQYATGEVKLTGTPEYTEPAGFIVGTANNINFETIEDVTLDINGDGYAKVVCTEIGTIGNVGVGLINVIVNPNADITAVTNLSKTSGGREKETDQEARERADITVEGLGSGTPAAVRAELLKISDVRAAFVVENDTLVTDIYGTPGKALQSFVLGGDDNEIAQAIIRKKAGGIRAYGTTVINATDIGGYTHPIGFTRASVVRIYAKITLSTDATFTANGESDVKNALINYIGGTRTDGSVVAGLTMGEKVVFAKGLAHIMGVDGVTDANLTLSTDGLLYDENNIDISIYEVAQLNAADIEVTINV